MTWGWLPSYFGARGRQSNSIKAGVDMVSLYQRRGDARGQALKPLEASQVVLFAGGSYMQPCQGR